MARATWSLELCCLVEIVSFLRLRHVSKIQDEWLRPSAADGQRSEGCIDWTNLVYTLIRRR